MSRPEASYFDRAAAAFDVGDHEAAHRLLDLAARDLGASLAHERLESAVKVLVGPAEPWRSRSPTRDALVKLADVLLAVSSWASDRAEGFGWRAHRRAARRRVPEGRAGVYVTTDEPAPEAGARA